jgi:hypothetical protein
MLDGEEGEVVQALVAVEEAVVVVPMTIELAIQPMNNPSRRKRTHLMMPRPLACLTNNRPLVIIVIALNPNRTMTLISTTLV